MRPSACQYVQFFSCCALIPISTFHRMSHNTVHIRLFPKKNVTSERPIALGPTMIRWWEAMIGPEVVKWQQRYRIEWDATDGRNGGAPRAVWGNWLEMEMFEPQAGEKRSASRSPRLGLGEGLQAGQSPSGLGLGDALQLPKRRSCGCFVGILSTRGVHSSKDVWRSRSRPSRLSCQGQNGVACFSVL